MAWQYVSTFPTGFEEVISSVLLSLDAAAEITLLQDGLIFYTGHQSPQIIKGFPCFTNSFLLLSQKRFEDTTNVKGIMKDLMRMSDMPSLIPVIEHFRIRSFRIILMKENELQPIDHYLRTKWEQFFLQNLPLTVDRTSPDSDIWVSIRRDGTSFMGLRLTKRYKTEKGELGKEVSYLLNFISSPESDDVFLDPFSGSGAIPFARATFFPYKKIIASDKDPHCVEKTKTRLHKKESVEIFQSNALNLSRVENSSINVVVTDPPWGYFEEFADNPLHFYSQMLKEIHRVLVVNGRVVILMGRKDDLVEALTDINWSIQKSYNVLISGKKAGVFVLKK